MKTILETIKDSLALKMMIVINITLTLYLVISMQNPNKSIISYGRMDSTALDILYKINQTSMHEDAEYAGLIIASQSKYFATTPVTEHKQHTSHVPGWHLSLIHI